MSGHLHAQRFAPLRWLNANEVRGFIAVVKEWRPGGDRLVPGVAHDEPPRLPETLRSVSASRARARRLATAPGAMDQLVDFALQLIGATATGFSAGHHRSGFSRTPRHPVQSLYASPSLAWIFRGASRTRLVAPFTARPLEPLTAILALSCGPVVSRWLEIDT